MNEKVRYQSTHIVILFNIHLDLRQLPSPLPLALVSGIDPLGKTQTG